MYWSGINGDVARYCHSCDVCQKTVSKGTVPKVPLQSVPVVDIPFKRAAVDLMGLIDPPSEAGHRYILTLLSFQDHCCCPRQMPQLEGLMQSTPHLEGEQSRLNPVVENTLLPIMTDSEKAQPQPLDEMSSPIQHPRFITCATSPMVALYPSIKVSMMKSFGQPPNMLEEKLYTQLTKRKLNFARDKPVARCKTGG